VDIKTDLFEGGFEILADFLTEKVGVGEVVGFLRLSSLRQKMSRLALSRLKISSA